MFTHYADLTLLSSSVQPRLFLQIENGQVTPFSAFSSHPPRQQNLAWHFLSSILVGSPYIVLSSQCLILGNTTLDIYWSLYLRNLLKKAVLCTRTKNLAHDVCAKSRTSSCLHKKDWLIREEDCDLQLAVFRPH